MTGYEEDLPMDKKRIMALAGIMIVLILFINFVVRKKSPVKDDYVFDRSSNIKLRDVNTFYKAIDFEEKSGREYLTRNSISTYTLKFFISLELKFKNAATPEEHLEKVKNYLYEIMSYDEADSLFALYKTYINYKLGLIDKRKIWGSPKNPQEAIRFLHKLQVYSREVFGKETADAL